MAGLGAAKATVHTAHPQHPRLHLHKVHWVTSSSSRADTGTRPALTLLHASPLPHTDRVQVLRAQPRLLHHQPPRGVHVPVGGAHGAGAGQLRARGKLRGKGGAGARRAGEGAHGFWQGIYIYGNQLSAGHAGHVANYVVKAKQAPDVLARLRRAGVLGKRGLCLWGQLGYKRTMEALQAWAGTL